MPDFFVSCPLGFEQQLAEEMENFWHFMLDLDGLPTRETFPEIEIVKGGLEFSAPLHLGFQVNFFTHIGLRVLLRIQKFKARYFDQFEKEIKSLPLDVYLTAEKTIDFEIESTKSRLFHEKNLKESFAKALNKKWKVVQAQKTSEVTKEREHSIRLYVRIFNDEVVISLDTTGAHLHFRGYRKQQGAAPLRENLAALMLLLAGLGEKNNLTVIDPFCGAGTLLFESALLGYPNLARDYAFFQFKNCPALFRSPTWSKNYRWLVPKKLRLIGIEKDPETYAKAQANLKIFQEAHFKINVELQCADSSKVGLGQFSGGGTDTEVWLVANPPYGERLDNQDFQKVLQHFEELSSLQTLVILQPQAAKLALKNFKVSQQIPFTNQGLKLNLSIYTRTV